MERMKSALTSLDDPQLKRVYGDELETVDKAHQRLAEAYYEVLSGALVGTIGIILMLVVFDLLIYIDAVLYGLTINIWASLFILYPSLRGRYMVAAISENVETEAIRKMETRRGVFTLVGWFLMAVGFGLQVFARQSIDGQFLALDILESYLPEWSLIPYLIIVFYVGLRTTVRGGKFATGS